MIDRDGTRHRIAHHLRDHAPCPGDAMTAALGLDPNRFWAAICCPWYELTGKGYRLTGRGRREALGEPG